MTSPTREMTLPTEYSIRSTRRSNSTNDCLVSPTFSSWVLPGIACWVEGLNTIAQGETFVSSRSFTCSNVLLSSPSDRCREWLPRRWGHFACASFPYREAFDHHRRRNERRHFQFQHPCNRASSNPGAIRQTKASQRSYSVLEVRWSLPLTSITPSLLMSAAFNALRISMIR